MNKIAAAYQQFSQPIQKHQGTQTAGAAQSHTVTPPKQSPDSPPRMNHQQLAQLQQLRESGTLDNLQAILSEDEASLLSKLFPEGRKSYDAGAQAKPSHQQGKGSLLDTRY